LACGSECFLYFRQTAINVELLIKGVANEKIVATAIYYYDSDNIEGDALAFRQAVTFVWNYIPLLLYGC
jgi:hypothetical protein